MNLWSKSIYKNKAYFICICCDSPKLAITMGERMKLDNCINSVIVDPSEGPYWGQLGCSGFIMIHPHTQKIITKKTMAFQEIGEKAFRNVESIIDNISEDKNLYNISEDKNLYNIKNSNNILNNNGCSNGKCGLQINKPISIKNISKVQSVNNQLLDKEHDECLSLLRELSKNKKVSSLNKFLDHFKIHCGHEEFILNKFIYIPEQNKISKTNGISLLLNSRDSHFNDHKKIIFRLNKEIKKLENKGISQVSVDVIDNIILEFTNHTDFFDNSYSDMLAKVFN